MKNNLFYYRSDLVWISPDVNNKSQIWWNIYNLKNIPFKLQIYHCMSGL